MKRLLLLLLIVLGYAFNANAQTPGASSQVITRRRVLDEKTIVKDSTGAVMSYKDWQDRLSTGQFTLRRENDTDENSAFIVIRMTADQRAAMMARMPPPNETGYFTMAKR